MSAVAAYLIAQYGPQIQGEPQGGFASQGEQVVYEALVRRIGRDAFVYQYRPGDIRYTAEREERSADFLIPSMGLVILVNSAFTHPSAEDDQHSEYLFGLVGYRTYFVWDYEILTEMGGDVEAALDKIPGLAFVGQVAGPRKSTGFKRKRTFGQPPRDITFSPAGIR